MRKWIFRFGMILCVSVFAYSAYQLYGIFMTKDQVKQEVEQYESKAVKVEDEKNILDPDWDSLLETNPNLVGWVYVPGCDISFPVVQGKDNDYYLDHTLDGSYNQMGAIFLDSHASSTFSDDNSIIYGHSVEGGGMFTSLDQFEDRAFFDAHPTFYLLTPNENYEVNIYSFAKTQEQSVYYTTTFGSNKDAVMKEMMDNSLYSRSITVSDDPFISLSTCDLDYGFNSIHRLVLNGQMHPTDQAIVIE